MTSRSHNYIKLTTAVLVIAMLAIGSWYWYHNRTTGIKVTENNPQVATKPIDYTVPSNDQKQNGAEIKKQSNADSNSGNAETPPSNLISITSTNTTSDTLYIRTLIQAVSSTGSCSLTMSYGQKSITRTSRVQAMASASTCMGFDIPLDELGAGLWKISITYMDGSVSSRVAGEVTL